VVKALANGRRLGLVELLAQGEHSVEQMAEISGMGVTSTSAHLQNLKQAGLVRTRRDGTRIYYRLAGDDVAALYLAAKQVGLARYPQLREALEGYMQEPGSGRAAPTIEPAAITGEMTVIDVRPEEEFRAGHFPGSISIPLAELADRVDEIDPGSRVVVYCRGEICRMAREAAGWLRERGIDALAMDEGVVEWRGNHDVELGVS